MDITTTPTSPAGPPRPLFKLQPPAPGAAQGKVVSPDGQRFIALLPATAPTPSR